MEYFKIAKKENGKVKALFHGSFGSREFPVGEWVEAEKKEGVIDGTDGTPYTSGLHVIGGFESTRKYLKNFRKLDDKVIVKCEVDGEIRKKEHSRSDDVYLVDRMKITEVYNDYLDYFRSKS